jgi:DNA-3-methyladenine glycosylase I
MHAYHDDEWGLPDYDSRSLWEMLMLEGFQAGLSWITVLRKREDFRKAFKGFEPTRVARFAEKDMARLLENPGIIRSRARASFSTCNSQAGVFRLGVGAGGRQADSEHRAGSGEHSTG